MDMLEILGKTPLNFIDDETMKEIYRRFDSRGWHCLALLIAAEYGRIIGKREERAKKRNHIEKRRIANG